MPAYAKFMKKVLTKKKNIEKDNIEVLVKFVPHYSNCCSSCNEDVDDH